MNSVLKFFNTRRTIRSFAPQTPPAEIIDSILEAAAHAPNTGNMQTVAAIVSSDDTVKAALSPLHFNQPCVSKAPYVITFCADFNRFEHWCHMRDAQPGFDNLQSLMAAVVDASIFAQQFCTIAEMYGLGGVFLGTTLYNAEKIAETLDLPEKVIPVITMAVGYPADDAAAGPTDRLPARAIIHHEKYQDFSDEEINRLYSKLEAEDSSKKFIEENGKKTLAQVFTDIRYPRASAEAFSVTLKEFLKRYID